MPDVHVKGQEMHSAGMKGPVWPMLQEEGEVPPLLKSDMGAEMTCHPWQQGQARGELSTKKAQVASLRWGYSRNEQGKWHQHIVDTLEVVNVEHQATHMEFSVTFQAIEYMAEALTKELCKQNSQGVKRQEMQETGVGTSKVLSKGQG